MLISEVRLKDRESRRPTGAAHQAWAKYSRTLQEIAFSGFSGDPATLTGIGRAERVSEGYCGWNLFSMLPWEMHVDVWVGTSVNETPAKPPTSS